MGLLDRMWADPSGQAITALAGGLLGVRRGDEGRAIQNALRTYNVADEGQRRNQLVDLQRQQVEMQMARQRQQQADEQAFRAALVDPVILKPGQPGVQGNEMDVGQPAVPPSLDQQALIQAFLRSGNPSLVQKALEMSAKAGPVKLGKGDKLLDPTTYRTLADNTEAPEQWEDIKVLPDGRIMQRKKGTGELKISGGASTSVTVGLQAPYAGVDSQGNPIVVQPTNRPGAPPQVLTGPDGKPIRPTPSLKPPMDATAMKQVTGVKNLQGAIDEYVTELGSWNATDIVSPTKRAAMGVKYNNMMLQAKEAYNLGVLNGPDFMILTSVVTDPRSMTGAITPNTALAEQAKELKRIMGSVGKVVQDVHRRGPAQEEADPLGLRK